MLIKALPLKNYDLVKQKSRFDRIYLKIFILHRKLHCCRISCPYWVFYFSPFSLEEWKKKNWKLWLVWCSTETGFRLRRKRGGVEGLERKKKGLEEEPHDHVKIDVLTNKLKKAHTAK